MIIVIIKDNTELLYEYMPLFNNSEHFMEEFIDSVYKKYGFEGTNLENNSHKWFKNIYWKLDEYSCVYVPRNNKWFESALPFMREFWENIIQERSVPGSYLKYKPKSRNLNKVKGQQLTDVIVLG